jgi:tetratricopeptide (TPR) repeat protein
MNLSQQQIKDSEYRNQAEKLLANPKSPDDRARAYVTLGCICEHELNWEAAISNYARAIEASPHDTSLRYFSNNNLGYSLIQLGRYDEAEEYCEAAIEVDDERHNAHKNLGLARQGQGRWVDAAFCFARASRLSPSDPRSWWHLEQLLTTRPHLLSQSPGLKKEVELLRDMIEGNGCLRFH